MSAELLLDSSAWTRLSDDSLASDRVDEIASALQERRIAACLQFCSKLDTRPATQLGIASY